MRYVLWGGNIDSNKFSDIGDIVVIPDGTHIVGLPVLYNCTITDCEFYLMSLFVDENTGNNLKKAGFSVIGKNNDQS